MRKRKEETYGTKCRGNENILKREGKKKGTEQKTQKIHLRKLMCDLITVFSVMIYHGDGLSQEDKLLTSTSKSQTLISQHACVNRNFLVIAMETGLMQTMTTSRNE